MEYKDIKNGMMVRVVKNDVLSPGRLGQVGKVYLIGETACSVVFDDALNPNDWSGVYISSVEPAEHDNEYFMVEL
jgi:hypothetical protein